MADVSKLNADGVIYNIKDAVARRQVEKTRVDFQGTLSNEYYNKGKIDDLINTKADKATTDELKCYLAELGIQVFESYPYEWMYAIKDIQITDSSTLAIGYVKRTSTRNTIVLYLVENGALSTAKLYANVNSDITGYATYSNLAKTVTMTVNWDEIPYDTVVQFNNNYVLCSAWCYGNTRLEYLLNKAKEEAVSYAKLNKLDNTEGSVTTDNIANNAVTSNKIANGAITATKIAKNAVSGSNIAQNQINVNHLQSGAVTTDKLADEVKTSINSKYDSSNVETGSGSLTPGASYTDLIKSSNFTYQKTGKIVNIFLNIVFNACRATYVQFSGLPFIPDETSEQNRHMAISNKNTQAAVYPVKSTLVLNFLSEKSLMQDEVFKDVLTIEIG